MKSQDVDTSAKRTCVLPVCDYAYGGIYHEPKIRSRFSVDSAYIGCNWSRVFRLEMARLKKENKNG